VCGFRPALVEVATTSGTETGPAYREREHPAALLLVPLRLRHRGDQPAVLVVVVERGRFPAVEAAQTDAELLGRLDPGQKLRVVGEAAG
jgi:hypothetical protein